MNIKDKISEQKKIIKIRKLLIENKNNELLKLLIEENISANIAYETMLNVMRNWFINEDKTSWDELFKIRCEILKTFIQEADTDTDTDTDTILLFTAQILSVSHGPTLTTLAIAKAFKDAGKKPIIININSLDHENKLNLFIGNKVADFNQNNIKITFHEDGLYLITKKTTPSSISYKEDEFEYLDINGSVTEKINIIRRIVKNNKNKPTLFIGDNFYADIVHSENKNIKTLLCTTSLPTNFRAQSFIARKITDDDIKKNPIANDMIEYEFQYAMRSKISDYRPDGLKFVIVGSRINQEFDSDSIELINQIHEKYKDAEFHFYGEELSELLLHKLPKSRCQSHGFISDTNEIFRDKSFYINPMRNGGGTSAFEAMNFNIPILTKKYGDVYYTVGINNAFENNNEILDFIDAWLRNPKRDKYKSRLREISNFNKIVEVMINDK